MLRSLSVLTRQPPLTVKVVLGLGYGVMLSVYYTWLCSRLMLPEYPWRPPDLFALAVGLLLTTLPVLFLPHKAHTASQFLISYLCFLYIFQIVIIKFFTIKDVKLFFLLHDIILTMVFIALMLIPRLPKPEIPRLRLSYEGYVSLLFLGSLALLAFVVRDFGFALTLPSLYDVYGVRAEFRLHAQAASGVSRYSLFWLCYALIPLLLTISLSLFKKHRLAMVFLVVYCFGVALYIFAFTGFKSAALAVPAVFTAYFLFRYIGYVINIPALFFILFVSGLLFFLLGYDFALVHILRRIFVVSGLNHSYFLEYYSAHPPAVLAHSLLQQLAVYPVDNAPPFAIGAYYYGSALTSANSGIFADAFANFGFIGIPLAGLVLGIVLYFLDVVSRGIDIKIVGPPLVVTAYVLAYSGILTVLNTYGLFWILIALWLYPRKGESS